MTLPIEEQEKRKALLAQGLKKCSRCKDIKKISEFGKKKYRSDGLDSWCKQCNHEYKQEFRSRPENRAKERMQSKSWKRRNRKRVKEYNAQWNAENKELKRRLRRRWHLAHKEEENTKARERMKEWAKENRERHNAHNRKYRARKFDAEGFHTDDQIEMLFMLCENQCLVCGETENLAVDHIQPLNKGGTDWITNLQVLCKKHNGEKGDHHSTDYRPQHIIDWAEREMRQSGSSDLS